MDPKRIGRIGKRKRNNNQTEILSFNEKSDIYSVGVLLWEISSGKPPFSTEKYDVGLAIEIIQGYRETTFPDTPINYSNIYIGKYKINFFYFKFYFD